MLKAITHITLSILVLVLTIGITISRHYSNGEFYSFSIVGEAESCTSEIETCTMEDMSGECGMHNQEQENNPSSCSCEDTEEYVYFDADYTVSRKLKINNIQEKQIVIFASNLLLNYSVLTNKQFQYTDINSIVLKIPDFASIFQVFLC